MVILRSSSGGAGAEPVATTPKRRSMELDASSEFLSLLPASQRKSAKQTRSSPGLDDSFSSLESNMLNGHADMKQEKRSGLHHSLRTRGQRVKLEVSFADMEPKASSPVNEANSGEGCLRKSSRLQREGKTSSGKQQADVTDKVEGSSTPKRSRFDLQSQEEEEEEEDHSVRRSSRITRYKLDSRKQSVLYDRLITNTAEAVLQKMDDMQKRRRRHRTRDRGNEEELSVYTSSRITKSLRTDVESKDTEEENQGGNKDDHNKEKEEHVEVDEEEEGEEEDDEDGEDEEEEDEDGEDEEEECQGRYDFRQRKTVVRYQAPLDEPREPRKRGMYFKDHSSPTRRRFRFSSTAPRSPYNRRRTIRSSSERRRHAIHSSDSTSSSSDDDKFQRRRSKNRSLSVNRCLPMNLLKDDLLGVHKDRMKIGASLADVDPMNIDKTVRFESIGGLSKHISALKEMVVFPLLYPEVFERFKIQPPRGCLFYGPPGTGKTLVARALANECSQGERKVSFFMRKGADCLSKWVGESERQLRLLFDQAYQMRPSIIFFDEIDGLAPVRSSRQDQIHSSIVSTLLALMDGLDGRGEVVVIGATNRLDSIDPALRRPGRFDREFLFGLPDREARNDILKIHTREWTPPPSHAFLEELADKCVGYCGADIKAVCSEAVLCALRHRYPQIYFSSQKLVLDVNSIAITSKDFLSAMSKMVPAAHRAVVSPAKALIPASRPLLSATLQNILQTVSRLFPHAEQALKKKRKPDVACGVSEDELMLSEQEDSEVCSNGQTSHPQHPTPAVNGLISLNRSVLSHPTSYRPRLLLEGRLGSGQSSHLAPAVLHALEKFTVYTLDMAVLFGASATAPEETCAQIFVEAKRTSPSVLYIPHIGQWWETVGPALRATFLCLLRSIPPFAPILLLATSNLQYDQLSIEVQELFRMEYGEVFHVKVPTSRERRNFFEDLILNKAAKAPASKKKAVLNALEVLPVAAPPPPRQLTEEETRKLEEQEEDTLRDLRLFLRDVTNRLSQDKRFKAFTKPVDLEEVRDYTEVIKKPMDLSTVLCNIDRHQYETVKEFLQDVDLIWQNALEYNPDRDPSDRQIRHKACALKDTVHAIIKDELDEDFEKICVETKASRSTRDCSTARFAPSFYHVLPKQSKSPAEATDITPQREPVRPKAAVTPNTGAHAAATRKHTAQKKKRRKSRWSAGLYSKKKSSCSSHMSRDEAHLGSDEEDEDDEEEEVEKEGGAEYDEGTGGEEDPMVVDVELRPAPVQDGSFGHTVKERDSREGREEMSQAAGDLVIQCESGKAEHDDQTQNKKERVDEVVSDQTGKSEEKKVLTNAEIKNSETISVNTNKDSHTETERDTPGQCNTEESAETDSQKLTETEKCQTVTQADDRNNKVVTVEESKQNSPAKPMEVEKTDSSTTDASAAIRGEKDTGPEKSTRRITQALKSAVLLQQVVDVDKALQILHQETPPLVVDKDKLKELLERVVLKTEGFEVYQLEKLYALLCQSIYRHRRDYNKTSLIQELKQEIEDFC
ncbi:ATPase family AAA domain-containing protein 2-like isoform X2 [Clinocottus analis]|uniref:ATPase family AAA domain-containing protein 2-like isoform X2 n=1 Tax=Clinocottus analis TaxID=304258 RepID=UPI0035C1547C